MKIVNRKFNREYQEVERYEAGVVLSGAEVKSIRNGGLRLDDAYVKIVAGQPQLINAEISPYQFAKNDSYDPRRTRRLLLHKKELVRLQTKGRGSGGLTIVPVACYNKGKILKLEIALVRGRLDIDKRKYDKKKKLERAAQREVKEYLK